VNTSVPITTKLNEEVFHSSNTETTAHEALIRKPSSEQ